MATFRDIVGIGFPSGTDGLSGCQEVSIEVSGDEIEFSGCAQDFIDYRGLTNMAASGEATMDGAGLLVRNACGVVWKGTAITDVIGAELSEVASELADGSDCDTWITVLGVTGRSTEATVTTRSMDTVAGLVLGDVGDLLVKGKAGSYTKGTNVGAPDHVFTAVRMQLVSIQETGKHKDFGEAKAVFKGVGAGDAATAGIFTGGQLTAIHTGAEGSFAFSVKSATGGAAHSFTLTPAVVMGKGASLSHGEMVSETLSVKAYSTDGSTSPFTHS